MLIFLGGFVAGVATTMMVVYAICRYVTKKVEWDDEFTGI